MSDAPEPSGKKPRAKRLAKKPAGTKVRKKSSGKKSGSKKPGNAKPGKKLGPGFWGDEPAKRSRPSREAGSSASPARRRLAEAAKSSSDRRPPRDEASSASARADRPSRDAASSPKRSRPARDQAGSSSPKRSRPARDEVSSPKRSHASREDAPSFSPKPAPRASNAEAMEEPRMRLALSHQGGPTRVDGDVDASDILREAFEAAATESPDTLTHNIHGYPARMHPAIARTLIASLSRPGDQLLDPFCGSGTTMVEARVAGMLAAGVDLNPLGLRVAEIKTQIRSLDSRERFLVQLEDLALRSEMRVRDREPVVAPVPRQHVRWYAGHVLKELGGLWEEIRTVPRTEDRRAFELLLSSVVMKFSYRRSESDTTGIARKLRKGLVTEHFYRRGLGLVERWAELESVTPADSPEPWLIEGDARRLPKLLGEPPRADLVITSPPYGGTYDYVMHHELRYPWLDLDPANLERYEVGARRNLSGVGGAGRWERELLEVLRSVGAVMVPRGVAVFLVGDAQFGDERVAGGRQLRDLAQRAGFTYIASASQPRPDFTGRGMRQEHLVLLERQAES